MQNTEIIIYIHNLQLNSERRRKKDGRTLRKYVINEFVKRKICGTTKPKNVLRQWCAARILLGPGGRSACVTKIGFLLSVRSLIRKDKRKKTEIRKKNRRCVTKKNVWRICAFSSFFPVRIAIRRKKSQYFFRCCILCPFFPPIRRC